MPAIQLRVGQSALITAIDPKPDQGLPGSQPRPDNTLPTPPDLGFGPVDPGWVGGVAPPGQEGGAPRPDQGLPGSQPHPDQGLPGNQPYPDQGLPPVPEMPPTPPGDIAPNWEKKVAWTPVTGWVVVAIPTGPTPTPSKRK